MRFSFGTIPELLVLSTIAAIALCSCTFDGRIGDSRSLEPAVQIELMTSNLTQGNQKITRDPVVKLNVTFNRDIEVFDEKRLVLDNAEVTKIDKISGTEIVLHLKAKQNGNVSIQLASGFGVDWSGADSLESAKQELVFDDIPPIISRAEIDPILTVSRAEPKLAVTSEAKAHLIIYSQSACAGTAITTADIAVSQSDILISLPSLPGDGDYNYSVESIDAAGNRTCSSTITYNLDTTPPLLMVLTPGSMDNFISGATITGLCEENLSLTLAGPGITAPQNLVCVGGSFSTSVTFTSGDGVKSMSFEQTDDASNTSTVAFTLVKDSVPGPPALTVSPTPGNSVPGTAHITGACEDGAGPVTISGSDIASTVSAPCVGGVFDIVVSVNGPDGNKTITISQTDSAGNTTSVNQNVVRDTVLPSAPTIARVHGAIQDNPVSVTLSSCTDSAQSNTYYQMLYQIDGGTPTLSDADWQTCAVATDLNLTGEGDHSIQLWVRDEAGNLASSNILNVKLDTVVPMWTSISSTLSVQRNQTANLNNAAVTASEEGSGIYSLGTPSSPRCSDYGSVSIDSATGAFSFVPTSNYYNRDNGSDYNNGPCHVLIQFADEVSPTPHVVTQDLVITVDWNNGINNNPELTAWPGNSGTVTENCGDKCYTSSIFDLSFTANPGGGTFPDPQNLTCSATTSDGYYIEVVSCDVTGTTGILSLMMGAAHAAGTDVTAVSLTISDGVNTVTRSFNIHVDNYVVNMYPALATSSTVSCILCHANIQADLVTDWNVPKTNYANANNMVGWGALQEGHIYHELNDTINFNISGALYMPNITVTDRSFIKQITGSSTSPAFNLASFLTNPFTLYYVDRDANGGLIMDTDGYPKVGAATAAKAAPLPAPRLANGIVTKSAVTIRAPSSTELLALAPSLNINTTAFVYKGPNSKPSLSGLQIHTYGNYGDGDHKFIRNNGTIVCHGTIVISGPLYLKNPDIQTDDVGCSIYVAGHVFIETDRSDAIQFVGGASSPTLQLSASGAVHMGLNLYEIAIARGTGGLYQAQRIANDANPSALKDAGGSATSIKGNNDAGAFAYMTCPLQPEEAYYLDSHYISNGNYEACKTGFNCAYGNRAFGSGYTGQAISGYSMLSSDRFIFNGSSLVGSLTAYETMCRLNNGGQMASYASYGWTWAGYWGEQPSWAGAATINALRHTTRFDHFRVNGARVDSRYFGTFNGSVISPYALFAIGNLVFTYDTRLNSVVPFPKMLSTNPIFKVED